MSVAVTAALVACSSGSRASSVPPMQTPPPSIQPNEVTPEPAVDLHRLPWTSVERRAGGRRLRVHATLSGGPPCAVLGRVDLDETADAVTVTLWVGRRPGASCGGPQPGLAVPIVVTVALHRPLGTRALRDGAIHRR
jgi:hypothetical protein